MHAVIANTRANRATTFMVLLSGHACRYHWQSAALLPDLLRAHAIRNRARVTARPTDRDRAGRSRLADRCVAAGRDARRARARALRRRRVLGRGGRRG